jgi:hypothetical protein
MPPVPAAGGHRDRLAQFGLGQQPQMGLGTFAVHRFYGLSSAEQRFTLSFLPSVTGGSSST